MGKVYQNKKCDTCEYIGKVIETWGNKYCKPCWDKRPKKGNGNSGMIGLDTLEYEQSLFSSTDITLENVPKSNMYFGTLYFSHYPKSKGIVGRSINYLIKRNNEILGIIGGNSPPLSYKIFNEYFGSNYTELNWLNNNVFRLINNEKNLGTKVLKLFRQTIKQDYEKKFGDILVGIITFVEPPRTGSIYKADNWSYLGLTQGIRMTRRGDHGKWLNKEWTQGTQKHIYGYKYK